MKKKWIKVLATLFLCAMLALGFTACEEESGSLYVGGENNEQDVGDSSSVSPDSNLVDTASISFKTFSVDGTNVYGKVSNTTEEFSFINEITTTGTAKFVVSLDVYGIQQVATKTIPLSVGDNKVYVIEMIDGEPTNVYTVTIRRKPMYTVTFEGDDGTFLENQLVEEDSLVNKPTATKAGYILANWDYDFSKPITKDTTIIGCWQAINYPVSYNLSGGSIDDKANPTTYTIETDISLVSPTRENYEFLGWYNGENEITTFVGLYGELELTAKWKSIFLVEGNSIMGLTDYGKENYTVLGIPSEIDGVTITNIGLSAFAHYKTVLDKLTKVVIPATVVSIEADAFCGCYNLTEVVIPYGVENIGGGAFCHSGLTSITIPDSVINIGKGAFSLCHKLREVVLSNSIISIEGDVFYDCPKLQYYEQNGLKYLGNPTNPYLYLLGVISKNITTANINKKCIAIGSYAFSECFNLASVEIPDNVKAIGMYAFFCCESLANIMIPDSVTSIGTSAFERCHGLTSVTIGNNVRSIDESAFGSCSSLTSIIIPDSVTSIGNYAFSSCNGLTNVVIGNGVTSLGESVFEGCSSLTEVIIPNAVVSIGTSAFGGCVSLTSVIFKNSNGWRARPIMGGRVIFFDSGELSNPSTAASYLKSTYCHHYKWVLI